MGHPVASAQDDSDLEAREAEQAPNLTAASRVTRGHAAPINLALFLFLDIDAADERHRPGDAFAFVRAHHAERALSFLIIFAQPDGGLTVDFRRMNPRVRGSIGMPNEHRAADHAPEDSLPGRRPRWYLGRSNWPSLRRLDGLGLGTLEEPGAHASRMIVSIAW